MKRPRLVVVGSINVDLVVKSARLPAVGETVTGGRFAMVDGGKGANQAVAAARLGADVALVARVGQDHFGQQALATYRREGLVTDWILSDPQHPTGVALILVDEQGRNSISVASGANHALTPEDVERAAGCIRAADMVLVQLEIPLETVRHTVELAAKHGVAVLLDPAPAPAVPPDRDLLQHIAYIKPNETEAEQLTGVPVRDEASARQAAERLLQAGARHAIITLGAKGAYWLGPGQEGFVSAVPVQAVDSTAAGDAFSAGLACALARGLSLEESVGYAGLVGALSVTRFGAQPSLPSADEVRRFAEEKGLA
jgi:ribokinase